MLRTHGRLAAVAVAVLAVAGLGMVGPTGAVVGGPDATGEKLGTNAHMTQNESSVGIDVDCAQERVDVTAPEDHQYDVSVTVANVTPTSSDVSRSALGSVEGNTTVDIEAEGIVFTVVRTQDGSEVTDVTDCTAAEEEEEEVEEEDTTTPSDDAVPEIDVDCEDGVVRFNASEGSEYIAKVTSVDVSSTGTSTSSTTQTLAGNATVSVDDGELVVAFASTGELGDDQTVTAIRNCSTEEDDEN